MKTYTYEELVNTHPYQLTNYTFITTELKVRAPDRGLAIREVDTRKLGEVKSKTYLEGILDETMLDVIDKVAKRFGVGKESEPSDFLFRLV